MTLSVKSEHTGFELTKVKVKGSSSYLTMIPNFFAFRNFRIFFGTKMLRYSQKRVIPFNADSGIIQGAPKLDLFSRKFELGFNSGLISRKDDASTRNEFCINEIIITFNILLGFRSNLTFHSILN